MNKLIRILIIFLIFLVVPLVSGFSTSTDSYSVGSYHTGSSGGEPNTTSYTSRSTTTYQQGGNADATTSNYSFNAGWFESVISEEVVFITPSVSTGGGGGGVTAIAFDVDILEFDSPVKLGGFFDFTYFVKGIGDINNDVALDFWIEKDEEIITSGSSVIFMGFNEEKTGTANLFLPSDIVSGIYKFVLQATFQASKGEAHRTIEIAVKDGEAIISKLFDIFFRLEDPRIENSDELLSIVTFESFGTEPTQVDLTFIILDEKGEEVHREEESIVVETEKFLRKSFEGLDLPQGKYTLVLQTLYNINVFDEFSQDFEIVGKRRLGITGNIINFVGGPGNILYFLIVLLIIVLIVLTLYYMRRHFRKLDNVKN